MEMGGQVGRWEAKQGDGWLSKYIGGEVIIFKEFF
jgi:hypothetical protein